MRRLNVLTWHTHGSYLYYLSHAPHDFHVLHKPGRPPGYGGRCGPFPFGPNVHDLPAEQARERRFDCILFQEDHHWLRDQHELLTPAQRALPRIYLEHDPPGIAPSATGPAGGAGSAATAWPTDLPHLVDDPEVLLVHVTPFNRLMWNSGRTPTRVIEHGVAVRPSVRWHGELARGLTVTNHLARRGRRMGADLFQRLRDGGDALPLDLVGMGAADLGGLGEIDHPALPPFMAAYRFLFSPVRYSSLSLGVIEAMAIGMPVVALATAEMATVIEHGVSGFAVTDEDALAAPMRALLRDAGLAQRLGEAGRRRASERFSIARFSADWDAALRLVTG
ncbi:glycosyltransferase family 4 protein [Massilia sp. YIM B02763]|uniref:glycosyltransferase family 4 protein n=1 Tax=Massilia sp. YIM B02763 TaxID=3050130 RepID=UPI0025B70830|nr:glycosyltransferase family 4 protein [Massilia sp. YIM B02763]MDN4052933.1 glycosyltransferase family 4 protein [Massilia sp. YIM B02763]